jgi:hypothetical protein
MATHKLLWLLPLIIVMILGCIVVLLSALRLDQAGAGLFREYVLDPIPPSVAEIKVDHPRKIFGYGYTFRFKIARADVTAILDSRPFQKIQNAKYETWGTLHFEWSPTSWHGLAVYPSGKGKPGWFTPDLWQDPEAYAYEERAQKATTYVLLYNEPIGEAYFLAFRGDYTP